jgi:OHCU decarboxylase
VNVPDPVLALNELDAASVRTSLLRLCGSQRWAALVERGRPYESADDVVAAAEQAFDRLDRDDWLEAFAAHARIGEPRAADPRGAAEQSGVSAASPVDLEMLGERNTAYEARFGHVFLICAAGLDAPMTIAALDARYENAPAVELALAGAEQRKITRLRLQGLLVG